METSKRTPILVTGGTGRHGGTGRAVIEVLLREGWPVRALVRNDDERSRALAALGAEVVHGDYADYASLLAALEGVDAAYFCYPVAAGIAEAAGLFAAAARAQGVARIVDLSLAASRPDSPSPQGRAQWVTERIFEWAGIDCVHLRIAAFFMENILLVDSPFIRQRGTIANSFGDYRLNWIAGRDVGEIAARLLLDDPPDGGKRIVTASGAEQASYDEIARLVSDVVGTTVSYQELTPEAWRRELVEASTRAGAPNVRGAEHLAAQSVALRGHPAVPVSNAVRDITGRAPTSLRQFITGHRASFTPA